MYKYRVVLKKRKKQQELFSQPWEDERGLLAAMRRFCPEVDWYEEHDWKIIEAGVLGAVDVEFCNADLSKIPDVDLKSEVRFR